MMKSVSLVCLKGLRKSDGGLTESEVADQRSRFGNNDIVGSSQNFWLQLLFETFKDPMLWLLVSIGAVFVAIGETTDGITLFAAVLPLFLMDAFLHWRTQASISTLKSHLGSRTKVIRDSKELDIDTRDVVPGDLLIIDPGVLLPADGFFEAAQGIQMDESVLTGESLPITKQQASSDIFAFAESASFKASNSELGFAGTRVLTGGGRLRAIATGRQTLYGEIVQSVLKMPQERTPLQQSISRLVQVLIYAAVVLCLVLAAIRLFQGHGWLDALLSAGTLAVAAIPEEFPVVFTFFLGVGIFRLARKKVLVRRSVSIENIGRVTVICTDKTGTITEGNLSLTHIVAAESFEEKDVLLAALIASSSFHDPMDRAIQALSSQKHLAAPGTTYTFPFTEDRKRETGIALCPVGKKCAYMKGAPETTLSHTMLDESEKASWRREISNLAKAGHKVIAVAQKELDSANIETEPCEGFHFCGLLAFEDPARPEVPTAMRYCRDNHIRVLMITGDHPETAAAIAKDSGLTLSEPRVISAEDEPKRFEERELLENPTFLRSVDVVARCTPIHKLRIVNALKSAGELVAVTGDGVNDVPALKAADIGIAMGERGSRSAREVSSIILSDDNFSTIVNAIREGRQLFENLRLSFTYLLLIHIPLVVTAAVVPLLGYPLLFLPIHIVWLELLIHPTALFAFQYRAVESVQRQRPHAAFFHRNEFIGIAVVGLVAGAFIALSFILGLDPTGNEGHGRAKAMVAITFWSAGILAFLTKLRTKTAAILFGSTILSTIALVQTPILGLKLHLLPLHLTDWLTSATIIAVVFMLKVNRRFSSIS